MQDWQTGGRGSASQTPTAYVAGTRHLDALIDPSSAPYIAPEAYTNPLASGVALDVFGLGAIAYHVFTGLPPATGADDLLAAVGHRRVGRHGGPAEQGRVVVDVGWRTRECDVGRGSAVSSILLCVTTTYVSGCGRTSVIATWPPQRGR
ncbi:MAG: hypothetical protein M3467_05725 [Actinomycetota bacterium]|nr:hypothetical protein [Actinomycetota bacterium]